jgi:hypothetical protein
MDAPLVGFAPAVNPLRLGFRRLVVVQGRLARKVGARLLDQLLRLPEGALRIGQHCVRLLGFGVFVVVHVTHFPNSNINPSGNATLRREAPEP